MIVSHYSPFSIMEPTELMNDDYGFQTMLVSAIMQFTQTTIIPDTLSGKSLDIPEYTFTDQNYSEQTMASSELEDES